VRFAFIDWFFLLRFYAGEISKALQNFVEGLEIGEGGWGFLCSGWMLFYQIFLVFDAFFDIARARRAVTL